jgi:hypothetical protein
MRKMLVVLLFLLIPTVLSADTWSPTADVGNPAPAGTTYAAGPLGAVGGIGTTLFPSFSGPTTITVEDCCIVGDVYEVVVGGTSYGWTSPQPMGGSTLSSGVFLVGDASAGIGIWDITLSYIGSASPFGGGVVGSYMSPAGLTVTAVPTPEPTSLLLLGCAGLVGLAYKLKRKKS